MWHEEYWPYVSAQINQNELVIFRRNSHGAMIFDIENMDKKCNLPWLARSNEDFT